MRSRLQALVRRWLAAAGYVPAATMTALQHQHDGLVRELRHKNRDLEQTIVFRDRLKNEIEFLRKLELARTANTTDFQQAMTWMDKTVRQLTELMQGTWPHAIIQEDVSAPAGSGTS